jgi:pimeloyl-ACP methyl ester carboxylesterase
MQKENLVLVHSFPTNSILLKGYSDYLSDHYMVYFIDLPGFTKAVPPLDRVSLDGFCRFVESRIGELNLDHYLIEGISFGFAIVNQLDLSENCKGIIAVEPFLGCESLIMKTTQRALLSSVIRMICALKLYSLFWKSLLFASYLPKLGGYPAETMEILFEQIDGRTFFETARLILCDRFRYRFHNLPYALLANRQDRSVNFEYIYRTLSRNVKNLLVINIEVEHYPRDTSKEYFQQMVPDDVFPKIASFFSRALAL